MPNFRQRKWLWIGIAIAAIVIITLVAAPNSSGRRNDSGSTYGRNPDGYGAWYEYMLAQDVAIKRWRKPFSQLIEDDIQDVTYVQILSKTDFLLGAIGLSKSESNWVAQGNTLVIIGNYQPATAAPFRSLISHRPQALSASKIEVETTRRYRKREERTQNILEDRYGAVVWQKKIGKGKAIYCTTPYLAANAYQDSPDNYQFLAELVSQNKAIWIDEYIHGYKDRDAIAQEPGNVLDYLAQTPLYLLFIQLVPLALIAAIAALNRFGQPFTPREAIADNSTAYIEALAGVLEKANCTDFVIETIHQDEQLKLQKSLGLGQSLVDEQTLITAWKQHQRDSAPELDELLQVGSAKKKISDAQLITWIQKWQKINNRP